MRLLEGVVVAHLTPFDAQGRVDHGALRDYMKFLIEKGVHGVFACGTTAEAQVLSLEERKKVLETIVAANEGKMTIVAHCGTVNFEDTCELIEHARSLDVDGAGVVTPFYYSYSQEELYDYYSALARKFGDFPLYLYNIPSLTGNNLSASTVSRLGQEFPNIVGIKDSSGSFNVISEYILSSPGEFRVIVGCDRLFLSVLIFGAHGSVTGPGGIFPEPFLDVWQAFQKREYTKAQVLQRKLIAISKALGEGASLATLKAALAIRGFGDGLMRFPLRPLSSLEVEKLREKLKAVLEETGYAI